MMLDTTKGPALLRLAILLVCLPFAQAAGAQESLLVDAVVRDASTAAPLAGVQVAAGSRGTLTDAAGRFRLTVDDGAATLTLQRIGYEAARIEAAALAAAGEILLAARPVLLDGLVVEGGRANQLAVGTALTVASVEGDALVSRGAATVAESLAGMEGVSVSRPGAWGAKATLRGLGGERLAVMVDGNRMNRACAMGMDQGLATLDPATIERVEVLSGPGSTLYGSGNVGGVINVVTRRGTGGTSSSGEVRAGASSAVPGGTVGATLGVDRGSWDATASLDGAVYSDYRTPAGTVAGTGFRQATADVKLGVEPAVGHRIQVQGQAFEGRDIGWPGAPGHEMSIPEQRRRFLSVDHGWQRGRGMLDALSARAFVQHLDHHMAMQMDGAHHGHGHDDGHAQVTLTDAFSSSTTSGGRLQGRLLPTAASHLDLGVEVTRWAAEGTRWSGVDGEGERASLRTWPDVRITDTGLFAQGELRATERVALTAGARLDRVTRTSEAVDGGTEWVRTGNVGLRAELGHGLSFRGGLGVGYRIPDPTELFGLAPRPDGNLYRGNPELATETNRNVEGTLGYRRGALDASVTGFRNDLRDLISPVAADGETVAGRPVLIYRNLTRGLLTGATARLGWTPDLPVEVRATATHTRGVDRETGDALPQIPPLEGSVTLRAEPSTAPAWVEVEGRGATAQDRTAPGAAEVATPAWGVVDLRTGVQLRGTALTLGVANLLDASYRAHLDPRDVYRPGRNVFLRATHRF